MLRALKRFLIGKPLRNEAMNEERYGILWGLPILSSDAISSVAYAGQEILMVLIPAIGVLAYTQMTYIAFAIIGLLLILMLSYRQTIEHYPNGGGAYIVAKENLGVFAGVTAGAALSVDYVLTVAVSVSSGIEQLTSTFPDFLSPFRIELCVFMVLLLTIGNLRGIRESSKIFGLPAYMFILGILIMIITGIVKVMTGYVPPEPTFQGVATPITLILLLRAFSSGCTALTGVEAVSNAVPNFKTPSRKYAKTVLLLLSIIILVLFGGTSILANLYHVVPGDKAMLILMAEEIFGRNFMFFYIMATTFTILVMAANTAYSGFPLLVAIMAKEGFVPRQLSLQGDRLSYSNGILVLSLVSSLLIVAFKANVTSLIGLYAIGVFISFTLSQSGMLRRWLRFKGKHWVSKAVVNGIGALVSAIAVIVIAYTKFNQGAWIVVLLIPIMIICMMKIHKHYEAVKLQLRIETEDLPCIDVDHNVYHNTVIVPIASINKASVRALRYAKTISDNVIAFTICIDEENGVKTRERYDMLNTDIPLIIRYSAYRKVVEPLLHFIQSTEYDYQKGDMITVILPQFAVKRWWQKILHNHTRLFIERELLKHKHIVVAAMPLQLKDDDQVLETMKF